MSVMERETAVESVALLDFEGFQAMMGHLSVAEHVALDEKAVDILSEAIATEDAYGPNSAEVVACDELVLLYACLESRSSIYRDHLPVPAQRVATS